VTGDSCEDCGTTDFRTYYGGTPLCNRCLDKRVATETGFPLLPEPPAPVTVVDGEGRRRRLRFRIWRAPTGIEVELEEMDVAAGDGYHRAVLGAHDADVDKLVVRLRELAAADLARRFLEPNPNRAGWLLADDVVEGRLCGTTPPIRAPADRTTWWSTDEGCRGRSWARLSTPTKVGDSGWSWQTGWTTCGQTCFSQGDVGPSILAPGDPLPVLVGCPGELLDQARPSAWAIHSSGILE